MANKDARLAWALRDDAVYMRMVGPRRTPGVQHQRGTDARPGAFDLPRKTLVATRV